MLALIEKLRLEKLGDAVTGGDESGAHGGVWAQEVGCAQEARVREAAPWCGIYVQILYQQVHRRTRQWRRRQEEFWVLQ
jgi:hypothetical protein